MLHMKRATLFPQQIFHCRKVIQLNQDVKKILALFRTVNHDSPFWQLEKEMLCGKEAVW